MQDGPRDWPVRSAKALSIQFPSVIDAATAVRTPVLKEILRGRMEECKSGTREVPSSNPGVGILFGTGGLRVEQKNGPAGIDT